VLLTSFQPCIGATDRSAIPGRIVYDDGKSPGLTVKKPGFTFILKHMNESECGNDILKSFLR
jgi:hypothetical protein